MSDLISDSSYHGWRSYSGTSAKDRVVSNAYFAVTTYINFYLIEFFIYNEQVA